MYFQDDKSLSCFIMKGKQHGTPLCLYIMKVLILIITMDP